MENNSKNIRPYKDLSSRKISASSSISLSSLLVPLILIVVVILSTVFISLNQNKLQKEISDVNLRLSTMEKNQADLGETSQITLESLEQNLKDANFEIRKLWDLSNKRNRRNIETTMKSLETLQEQSDDMVKKSQLNEESLKRLALSLDKTRKLVARISGADNSFDQLESKISEIEEANKSNICLLYTSPSPRDRPLSRMPSSA